MPVYEATAMNVQISSLRVKSRPCKWFTAELKFEMGSRGKLYRKAQKSHKVADKKEYKKRRIICYNKIQKAKANYRHVFTDQNFGD